MGMILGVESSKVGTTSVHISLTKPLRADFLPFLISFITTSVCKNSISKPLRVVFFYSYLFHNTSVYKNSISARIQNRRAQCYSIYRPKYLKKVYLKATKSTVPWRNTFCMEQFVYPLSSLFALGLQVCTMVWSGMVILYKTIYLGQWSISVLKQYLF